MKVFYFTNCKACALVYCNHSIEEPLEAVRVEVLKASFEAGVSLSPLFLLLSTPPPTGPHLCSHPDLSWLQVLCALVCCFGWPPFFPPTTASSNLSCNSTTLFKMMFNHHPHCYIITLTAHHSCPGSLTEIPRPRPE